MTYNIKTGKEKSIKLPIFFKNYFKNDKISFFQLSLFLADTSAECIEFGVMHYVNSYMKHK